MHRKPIASEITPFIQAKSEESAASVSDAVSSRIESTRGGGRPLPEATCEFMESRFRTDFSGVRLHADHETAQLSKDLNAQAFTVGHDIYFDDGKFAPATKEGRRLIAHELTHVVQQRPDSIVTRKKNDAQDQARSFGAILSDFNWQRYRGGSAGVGDAEKAKPFARQLMTVPATSDELLNNAISIAIWAHEHGLPDVRDYMLAKAENVWLMQFITEKGNILPAGGIKSFIDGPEALVRAAETAARAGDHITAFSLFGRAHLFYSYQILQLTEARDKALKAGQSWPAGFIFYQDAQHVYDELRGIYGFYFKLESEARDAGDIKRAAEMTAKAKDLRAELKDNLSFSGRSMLAEVSEVETLKGPGLTLHGANLAETDLTALPGLPPPEEVGNNLQWQDLDKVQEALVLQSDFLAEVVRVAEVQKEFKGKPIDMNVLGQRLRVWKAMYLNFQSSGGGHWPG